MRRIRIGLGTFLGGTLMLLGLLGARARTATAVGPDHGGDVQRVLQLTNAERESAGLDALTLSPQLSAAAQSYSQVLAGGTCFGHSCGGVPAFADRVGLAGYTGWTALAENVAAGYPTPDAVVAGWLASAGHRANMLSPEYHELGVGVVSGGVYGTYWTEEFGSRPTGNLGAAQPQDRASTAGAASEQP